MAVGRHAIAGCRAATGYGMQSGTTLQMIAALQQGICREGDSAPWALRWLAYDETGCSLLIRR